MLGWLVLSACSNAPPPKNQRTGERAPIALPINAHEPHASEQAAPHVSDVGGVLRFLRELCGAAESGNDDYVRAHTRLPLYGQEATKVRDRMLVGGVMDQQAPQSLRQRAVFRFLRATHQSLVAPQLSPGDVRGTLTLDGQEYLIRIERSPMRLVEQTLLVKTDVDLHSPLPQTSVAPVQPDVDWHAEFKASPTQDRDSYSFGSLMLPFLFSRWGCNFYQAVRDPRPVTLHYRSVTGEPGLKLYAVTPVDVAYLQCLQVSVSQFGPVAGIPPVDGELTIVFPPVPEGWEQKVPTPPHHFNEGPIY